MLFLKVFIGKVTPIFSMLLNKILSLNLLNQKEYLYLGSDVMKPKRKKFRIFFPFHISLQQNKIKERDIKR